MEPTDKAAATAEPVTNENNSAANDKQPLISSASEPSTNVKSANPLSQSHMSTAQNIFSGRPNAGLMCNNLRPNPFSVSDNSSNSSGLLAKPKFSLKPSAFVAGTGSASEPSNEPATIANNPFLRPAKLSYDNEDESGDGKPALATTSDKLTDEKQTGSDSVKEEDKTSEELPTESKESSDKVNTDAATAQVPILAPAATSFGSNISRASQSTFVFGEALDSRVTNVAKENGTNGHSNPDEETQKPKTLTLEEAADEYKKQQESGPILPEVETVTGEEEESNVLQISCKLFLFQDKNKSWSERGRGCLRLNDDTEGIHSRLVMRTVGIHRVILNTNIWPAMICERANLKSIRITGTESDQVHVYLITGSPSDIEHLHNAVTYRIQRLKQNSSSNTSDSPKDSEVTKRKIDDVDETNSKRPRPEQKEAPTE